MRSFLLLIYAFFLQPLIGPAGSVIFFMIGMLILNMENQ